MVVNDGISAKEEAARLSPSALSATSITKNPCVLSSAKRRRQGGGFGVAPLPFPAASRIRLPRTAATTSASLSFCGDNRCMASDHGHGGRRQCRYQASGMLPNFADEWHPSSSPLPATVVFHPSSSPLHRPYPFCLGPSSCWLYLPISSCKFDFIFIVDLLEWKTGSSDSTSSTGRATSSTGRGGAADGKPQHWLWS